MDKKLKIALAGPSGLGKSTLAKYIAKEFELVHPSTSAGDIFSDEDKRYLHFNFGYEGKGHQNVINLSSSNPDFGREFQRLIIERRGDQITHLNNFVIDRCPIDSISYILSQIGHNLTEKEIEQFIEKAWWDYRKLTHIIILKYSDDIPAIEDNQSRIPNRYFQKYISDVFQGVYHRYFTNQVGPRVITIDFWDLVQRKATVKAFIEDVQMKIDYGQEN